MKRLFITFLVLILFSSYSFAAKNQHKVNFDEVALEDVISYTRETTGVNIHVQWKALAVSGVDKQTPITLKIKNVSHARILDLICEQLNANKDQLTSIYYYIDREVLTITTGNILDIETEIRVTDVSDLLTIVPNFKGPRIEMNTESNQDNKQNSGLFDDKSGKNNGDDDKNRTEEGIKEMREKVKKTLKDIFIESIDPSMWRENGGKGSIKFLGNKMIISQTKLGYILMKKAGVLN